MDSPMGLTAAVNSRPTCRKVERNVVVQRIEVQKVFFDVFGSIAEGDYELVDPIPRVDVQDVPQDRLSADFDHRLGTKRSLLRQTGAHPAGKEYGLSRTEGLPCWLDARGFQPRAYRRALVPNHVSSQYFRARRSQPHRDAYIRTRRGVLGTSSSTNTRSHT